MILLGSETYSVAVTCSICGHTDEMYVPLDETNQVEEFLTNRGWHHGPSNNPNRFAWFCPKEKTP